MNWNNNFDSSHIMRDWQLWQWDARQCDLLIIQNEYTVGGKWGFIDKQGNEVVPLQYDSIANYRQVKNNKVLVLKDGKWKALQLSGR